MVKNNFVQWRTFATGLLMGIADLVPGISGGTVALLGGVYGRLLAAISHVDMHLLKLVLARKINKAWDYVDGLFLTHLAIGIISSILLMSQVISRLLDAQPLLMWSLFLGLIIVASVLMLKELYIQSQLHKSWLIIGLLVSLALANLPVLQGVEGFSGLGYLWLMAAGAVAISAMILPGISGSFILLILGIYPFLMARLAALDVQVIAVFALGCGFGLLFFSRLISYLLKRHTSAVMSLLAGLMMGSAVKLWPWKYTLSYRLNSAGVEVPLAQENLMPWTYSQITGADNQLVWCLLIALLAGLLVVKFGRIQLQDLAS